MIGSSRRDEAIRALQAEDVAIRDQLSALTAQLLALTEKVETEFRQQSAATSRHERLAANLSERMDHLEATLLSQSSDRLDLLEQQVAQIPVLDKAGEQHAEAIRQLRGDVVRLNQQAASDLDVLRSADAALTELILARPRT